MADNSSMPLTKLFFKCSLKAALLASTMKSRKNSWSPSNFNTRKRDVELTLLKVGKTL